LNQYPICLQSLLYAYTIAAATLCTAIHRGSVLGVSVIKVCQDSVARLLAGPNLPRPTPRQPLSKAFQHLIVLCPFIESHSNSERLFTPLAAVESYFQAH